MKLNIKRTTLIGFGFMSILCFWQFYDQVIPYLLENTFNVGTLSTNTIMAADNVLAIFMLPFFGTLSDKTKTKLGKRTPYVLYGTIVAVALMVLLSYFVKTINKSGFLLTLFALLVAMSVYRSPAVAYMPDVTPKPLRSKANAIINLVGYLGGIFATVVMMVLLKSKVNENGEKVYLGDNPFSLVFLIIAGFMLVAVLIMVLCVNENKAVAEFNAENTNSDEESVNEDRKLSSGEFRSVILILASVFLWYAAYNAVTTAFSRYCEQVWKTDLGTSSGYLLVATVVAIASFIPLGFVSNALGRKKTVLLGVVLMAVCYAGAFFIRHQTPIMYLIFGVVGIGWAAINVNSFPMVVDLAGGSSVGKFTGYYYTFSMAAQILTPILSGLIIENTPFGYKILFPYAFIFMVLAFITMLFVKHGDSKPEVKSVIEDAISSND